MAKQKEIEKIEISNDMLRKCKADISKFGFEPNQYEDFLRSVEAMRENRVLQFPNSDMQKYRELYLLKNEHGVSDCFALDNFKTMSCTQDGKKYETGRFIPRAFWDYILVTKYY